MIFFYDKKSVDKITILCYNVCIVKGSNKALNKNKVNKKQN